MGFLKYLQGEGNGARTRDGFPLRGNRVPFLKEAEHDEIEYSVDAHVRVFATDKPEEMAEYTEILDRIANQMYVRLAPDREEFLPDRKCWLIMVRWGVIKGDLPPGLFRRTGGYTQ